MFTQLVYSSFVFTRLFNLKTRNPVEFETIDSHVFGSDWGFSRSLEGIVTSNEENFL